MYEEKNICTCVDWNMDSKSGANYNLYEPHYNRSDDTKKRVILALVVILVVAGAGVFLYDRFLLSHPDISVKTGSGIEDRGSIWNVTEVSDTKDEVIELVPADNCDVEEISRTIATADEYAKIDDFGSALSIIQDGLARYPNSTLLANRKQEYMNRIAVEETISQAAKRVDSGDYEGALRLLNKCLEEYGGFPELTKIYDDYKNEYIEKVKNELIPVMQTAAESGKYEEAYSICQEVLEVVEDGEVAVLSERYRENGINAAIVTADNFLSNRDFDSAEEVVENALKIFSNSPDLLDEKALICNSRPKSLLDVCTPYDYNYADIPGYFTMAGETYTDGVVITGTTTGYGGYVLFNLKGKYSELEFDFSHIDDTPMNNCEYYVYLDEKMVEIIDGKASALPKHYTIELNNANQLKIVSGYGGIWDPKYGFANMTVY